MPIEPQLGTWYIVVICRKCESTVILFRDLTDGKGAMNAKYSVTCPYCRQKGEYDGRHYKHSPRAAAPRVP